MTFVTFKRPTNSPTVTIVTQVTAVQVGNRTLVPPTPSCYRPVTFVTLPPFTYICALTEQKVIHSPCFSALPPYLGSQIGGRPPATGADAPHIEPRKLSTGVDILPPALTLVLITGQRAGHTHRLMTNTHPDDAPCRTGGWGASAPSLRSETTEQHRQRWGALPPFVATLVRWRWNYNRP